jgi:hypothetical protein
MELLRDGTLEESDVVFCEWPRNKHFLQLRDERNLRFRLNQLPVVSGQLHHKKRFARLLKHRPYALRTFIESRYRRLRGVWVEKPYNVDRGEGITFLRDPRRWRRKKHVLQRYVDDPWLVQGRKNEVRMFARIDDDGSVRVYREALVRLAYRPFTIDDLDPLIHNGNILFQQRMGATSIEQHLLTDLVSDDELLQSMVDVVHDTVAVLQSKRRFRGTRDFEVLGYDFVVDREKVPFLIEVNRSPGLYFEDDVNSRFYHGMFSAIYRDI